MRRARRGRARRVPARGQLRSERAPVEDRRASTSPPRCRPDGVLHVEQRYRFDSDDGGTVALPKQLLDPSLPPIAQNAVGGIRDVTLDGAPVTPSDGDVPARGADQAQAPRHARLRPWSAQCSGTPTSRRAARRRSTGPEDVSRQDPDVALRGTLTLPEGPAGTIEPHFHGGRDRTVSVRRLRRSGSRPPRRSGSRTTRSTSRSRPIVVPDLARTPIPFLDQFHTEQTIRDQADQDTESTLGGLDDQTDLGRWIITAVAFGLPLIFWTLVVVGLIRRLRERKARRRVRPPRGQRSRRLRSTLRSSPCSTAKVGRRRTAVAGTILDLARRKDVDLQEYGDKVVLKVPLATVGVNDSEKTVLDELRRSATADGTLEGPHVWNGPAKWWRAYRRDLVKRARGMGLVERWMPLASLSTALVTTGIGFSTLLLHTAGHLLRDGVRGDHPRLRHLVRERVHAHRQGVAPARAVAIVRPSTSTTTVRSTRPSALPASWCGVPTSCTARCSVKPMPRPRPLTPERVG